MVETSNLLTVIYLHCLSVGDSPGDIFFLPRSPPTSSTPSLFLTPPIQPTVSPSPTENAPVHTCACCHDAVGVRQSHPQSCRLPWFCCRRSKHHATVRRLVSRYFVADHLLTPTPVCSASSSSPLRVSCHDQHVRRFESRRSEVLHYSLSICPYLLRDEHKKHIDIWLMRRFTLDN